MTFGRGSLLGSEALGDTLERLRAAIRPTLEVAGWATVELDRAERELITSAGPASAAAPSVLAAGAPPLMDTILGAHARRLELPGGDGFIVLLEPSTEGRLAAALARHGEGSLVRYLLARPGAAALARAAGFPLSAAAPGPLGEERLVLGGPREGPFILLVEA